MFSLLPGFRQLRTQLVTGYLYLLSIFLLANEDLLHKVQDLDLKALSDYVGGWVKTPAALAVSTFAAYLVGSVLEVHAATISRRRRSIRYKIHQRLARRHERQTSAVAELTEHAEATLETYIADRTNRSEKETAKHLPELLKDLPQLPTRLSAANKDL